MLSSPLANPLFPTAVATVGGLLLAGLAGLAASGAGWDGTLAARWRSWAAIALLYGTAALAGPAAAALLAAAVALQGAREYGRLAGLGRADRVLPLGAAVGLPAVGLLAGREALYGAAVFAALVATLPALLEDDAERAGPRIAGAVFGVLYPPLALAHLVLIAAAPRGGAGLLLALGLAVALSDVGAYLAGRAFGRAPLAPRLSPAKTRQGLLGNLAGALIGVWLFAPHLAIPTVPLALVVAAGAVWGDLLESALKRSAGVKDSGGWLPGFGGLLDRIDSLLVAAPLVYLALAVWP
ncbi:MAG TPA: phosphatidate cytidylyltransferase [Chloroflexota bacterium]|nr:phosphatidate cytidylyltransferase [Chloroflexota bacterium]